MRKRVRHFYENSADQLFTASLGKFLLVVAFLLVKGHFAVHYMCCTRMAFRLGVRTSSSTTKERWRGVSVFGR